MSTYNKIAAAFLLIGMGAYINHSWNELMLKDVKVEQVNLAEECLQNIKNSEDPNFREPFGYSICDMDPHNAVCPCSLLKGGNK